MRCRIFLLLAKYLFDSIFLQRQKKSAFSFFCVSGFPGENSQVSGGFSFSKRFIAVLSVFLLWIIVVGFKVIRIAVLDREFFIERGEKTARYKGSIPALRGRILDRNGVALAWSERYFDLCISTDCDDLMPTAEELLPLKSILPRMKYLPPDRVLCRNLTPAEVMTLETVVKDGKFPLIIRLREERIVVNTPAVRLAAGNTRKENGVLAGISGWEKEFDHILRAVPGRFTVLRDRWMNWIPASWQLLVPPADGKDAVVPFAIGSGGALNDDIRRGQ